MEVSAFFFAFGHADWLQQWKSRSTLNYSCQATTRHAYFVIGLRVFLMAVCGPTEACVSYS